MWEDFLNPEVLRSNLIVASIYIVAFEVLKNTIVDRLKSFYTMGLHEDGPQIDPKYQSEVLSKNPSPVYASLEWLKESQAIDDNDISAFERAKKCRNDFAHELPEMLMKGLPSDLPDRFSEMIWLVDKIGRWWVVNVDIAPDPQHDGKHVDEEQVIPGPSMELRLMMDIALAPEGLKKIH